MKITEKLGILLLVLLLCACPVLAVGEMPQSPGIHHAQAGEPVPVQPVETRGAAYVSVAEAAAQMKQHLLARDTDFTLFLQLNSEESLSQDGVIDLWRQLFFAAMEHNGNPKEGDYLDANTLRADGSYTFFTEDGIQYLTFSYQVIYYASAQQETLVDAEVARILAQLELDGKTDYEKIRAIYDYMAANICYDNTYYENYDYLPMYSAYAALVEHRAVCQGYASAFYRLALEAGVDARVVFGIAFNGEGNENHAWNIVKIGDVYYNMDITWDASYVQVGWGYGHFLMCDENFKNHYRDMSMSSEEFYRQYPMGLTDYPAEWGIPALPAAELNGVTYDHLYQALAEAGEGDVVTLLRNADISAETLILYPGVTLDLQGFDLQAAGLVGLTGSSIQADRYGAGYDWGLLLIPQDRMVFTGGVPTENGDYRVLPLWNGKNGYVFAQMAISDTGSGYGLEMLEDTKTVAFTFLHKAGKAANRDFLADGAADNALKILLRLQWQTENGTAYQDFVYCDDFVGKVASGGYDYTFILTGWDKLGINPATLRVTALIQTDCGLAAPGITWSPEQ